MRLFSGRSRVSGSKASRLLVAAALAGSLPLAVAQRDGGSLNGSYPGHIAAGYSGRAGGSYGHSLAGYAAPNFVSTFGPHSITGTAGANFVAPSGRLAPDFASSWGIAHPVGRGQNGGWNRNGGRDRDRDHDRGRSRYSGYGSGYPYLPLYNSWAVMPWAVDYSDYDNQQTTAAPENNESAGQQDEHRPPYREPESDYAPAPPVVAAPEPSSTVLESEPALTLIFKDGRQQAIRNYALTADAVIVLDKAAAGRQERIPLTDLNLPATEAAAQAAGLDFAPLQSSR